MKRGRQAFEGHHHPLQLRRVEVPESIDEWIRVQEGDAFRREEDWFQESNGQLRRPIPSVQILTSILAPPGGSTSSAFDPHLAPILQRFYEKIAVQAPTKGSASEETNTDRANQHDIDNPSFSSLTRGQHRRYLQLTSSQQTERRKEHERKELKSLTTLVKTEQSKFRECLLHFLTEHKDRFRTGFQAVQHPANPFCRWASNHQKETNQKWIDELNLPMYYGKCCQILSFPLRYTKLLDVDSLHFEVVHESQPVDNMTPSEVPAIGTQIKVPSSAPPNRWLKDDTVALKLAKTNGARIVTTAEALETMLQLPRDSHSRWMFFASTVASKEHTITILDRPISQPMIPRQCLQLGIQEGIRQSDYNSIQTKHVYCLWTLPATTVAMRRQPIRVLVRSTVRMVNSDGIPILIRPHMEYFPERGVEEASLYEKSLWILDQLLFQHNVQTRMARIDAQTCKILEVEETSVAHALAAAANKANNPMLHWQTVIQIFQSLPSVGLGEYLMCLPGQDTRSSTPAASIHAPTQLSDSEEPAKACVVNLETITSQAEAVLLNPDSLLYCYCDWKWTDRERIPFTFPFGEKAKDKQTAR